MNPEDTKPAEPRAEKPKEVKSFWPGKINYRDSTGHWPGCKAALVSVEPGEQSVADAINHFAEARPNTLVVDIRLVGTYDALILYTNVLSAEEIADFNEAQQIAQETIDKRKAEREALKTQAEAVVRAQAAEAQTKADAERKELERLADLGRKHEKNCGKRR